MTPLHHLGDLLRNLLLQVPLPLVRLLFIAIPVVVLIWVIRLPREVTTRTGEVSRWDENLKIGAAVALGLQIVIYALL